MSKQLSKYERETIILFNDADELAEIYTCNKSWKTKLDKLCVKTSFANVIKEDAYSKTYTFPKKWLRVRKPNSQTEELKQKRAEHMQEVLAKMQDITTKPMSNINFKCKNSQ